MLKKPPKRFVAKACCLGSMAMAAQFGAAQASISSVQYSPKPIPAAGGTVNVSCQARDAFSSLNQVSLYEYYPNGSVARSVGMSVASDGLTYSASITVDLNSSNSSNGESLAIVAADSGGHTATAPVATQGFSTTPPVIGKTTYSPVPIPIAGGTVSVTSVVKATLLPLSSVQLYEYYPNGSVRGSVGMSVASDGVTYVAAINVDPNISNSLPGETLYVVATDVAGNTKTVQVAQQSYSNTPPVVNHVTYSPSPIPVAGGTVHVSCQARDYSLPLTSVYLFEYYPNGSQRGGGYLSVASDGVTYSGGTYMDPNTSNSQNGESLVIVATDLAGNTTTVPVATQGYSNTPPTITSVSFSPKPIPVVGGTIDVSCKVRDALLPLTSVYLFEYYPNGSQRGGGYLSVASDGVTYSGGTYMDPNTSNSQNGESLVIVATDLAGNTTTVPVATQGYSNTPPTITSVSFSPKPIPVAGGTINVSCKVRDILLPLTSVYLFEYYPNGSQRGGGYLSVASDGVTYSGGTYMDPNTSNSSNGESLVIVATDVAGNTTTVPVATQGYSNAPPKISNVSYAPHPLPVAGGTVEVSCQVKDPALLQLETPTLYIYYPNGSIKGYVGMTLASDGITWTSPAYLDPAPTYPGESIYIVAADIAGNKTTVLVATQP